MFDWNKSVAPTCESRLRPRDADELFGWMVGDGQLQIIDLAKFQDPHAACC